MGVLTYLIDARVEAGKTELDGKLLTRPQLTFTDGISRTYAADVDIGQKRIDDNSGQEVVAPLRAVPIALGNNELIYADAGSAVRLRRSDSGRFEIVGFSKRAPGSYKRVPVAIPDFAFNPFPYFSLAVDSSPIDYIVGAEESIGLEARPLTYGELATLGGGYGQAPYGVTGVFRGGVLIAWVSKGQYLEV